MTTEATATEGQDVFDDTGAGEGTSAAATSTTTQTDDGNATVEGGATNTQGNGGEGNQQGDDTSSGTPTEGQDDLEIVTDAKGQKLIPEHRFKAALKSAAERAEKAERELAERDKVVIPVPDKEKDPEGHARHVRMEASVEVMREMRPDYQEVINHYAEMAKDNPLLDQAVDAAPLPAKLAYDIAKKDLEIKEALKLKDSDEWKEFQEFKKNKGKQLTVEESNLGKKVASGLQAVPNLNRSTNASPNRNVRQEDSADDDLFKGAL